jgi:predicted nucleotidyltransferase
MNSDFKDLLGSLCRFQVRYLVVGGYAVMHHTEPRFTKDLDLWIEPTPENAERLRKALSDFGAWLDHMSVEDFSKEKVMFQLGIPPVRIDLLTSIPGLDFAPSWNRKSTATIDGQDIPMVGLDDLITAKEHAGRDQDLLDLAKLKTARK